MLAFSPDPAFISAKQLQVKIGHMTFVRRILAVFLTAALVWAGSAAAQSAHAHKLNSAIVAAVHAMADDVVADHHDSERGHHHDHGDAADDRDDAPQMPHHEDGIFHVHSVSFVAVETVSPSVNAVQIERIIEPLALIVTLHSRSVTPADRPPRTFL